MCERAGHRSATFFTKNLLEDAHCMSVNWAAENGEKLSTMEAYLSKLFRLLPDDLQGIITEPLKNLAETLVATDYKDHPIVVEGPQYIVRRLTPTECARLQGFPDEWGEIGIMSDFSDIDYQFWLDVRNTYATINGKAIKDYTKPQMLTWYNKLHTDSAEYKMWGNGIALPTALYVMQGIADCSKDKKEADYET